MLLGYSSITRNRPTLNGGQFVKCYILCIDVKQQRDMFDRGGIQTIQFGNSTLQILSSPHIRPFTLSRGGTKHEYGNILYLINCLQ